MPNAPAQERVRLTAQVSGWVQGVGFRWSTYAVAQSLSLVGFAENLSNGDVRVIAEGPREQCQKVLDWLQGTGTRSVRRPGRVEQVSVTWGAATGEFRRFSTR
jgi:acylphosphatase